VHGSDSNNCKSRSTACKTIGHAISLASSGDSIMIAPAIYPEKEKSDVIGINLTLLGSGAQTTIIQCHGGWGYGYVGIVINSAAAHVTLSGLTVQKCGGRNTTGGGIQNHGILTINKTTINGNNAASGAGISNDGTMTVINTTISENGAGVGGGILNSGTLMLINSTVGPNGASGMGGGIANYGRMVISNSTIAENTVMQCARFGCWNLPGGNIYAGSGTLTLRNTIVAYGAGTNCDGPITSDGYNLSSDGTCHFSSGGDWNNTDPLLDSLQYNGGPTQTQALKPGSPAIDAGNPNGCKDSFGNLLKTDQRGLGYPRHDPEDARGCDMGAYEKQSD
jgi:hypothetical protein